MLNKYWNDSDFRLIIGRTGIDYDQDKEELNRKKHGYSLESAVYIFERALFPFGHRHPPMFTSEPIDINGEMRHNHLAVDDQQKLVFIVTTMRIGEIVRIISFRRANDAEKKIYISLCKETIQAVRMSATADNDRVSEHT